MIDPSKNTAIIFLANQGQDPTEVATPWKVLTEAGFQVDFATENGDVASADQKLLEKGLFGRALGATREAAETYKKMTESEKFRNPLVWSKEDFSALQYEVVILPGGHDKPIRQYLESTSLHRILAEYVPATKRDSSGSPRAIGAICHGVLALAFAKDASTGKSVLHGLQTTTLPKWMEGIAWAASQAWMMGGYYRTYGPEGRWCYQDVELAGATYVRGPMNQKPFIRVDPNYRYVSGRFPGDAEAFAKALIEGLM